MEKLKSITIDTYLRLGCAQADVITRNSATQLRVDVGTSIDDEKGQGDSVAVAEGKQSEASPLPHATSSAATQTQVSMTLEEVDTTWMHLQRFLDINDAKVGVGASG